MINSHVRFYCWEVSCPGHRSGCSSSPPPPPFTPPPPLTSPPPPQVPVTSQEDKEAIPPLIPDSQFLPKTGLLSLFLWSTIKLQWRGEGGALCLLLLLLLIFSILLSHLLFLSITCSSISPPPFPPSPPQGRRAEVNHWVCVFSCSSFPLCNI